MFNRILFWTTLTLSKRFFKQFHCIVLEKMNHKVSYNYISAFIIVSYFNCNKKKKILRRFAENLIGILFRITPAVIISMSSQFLSISTLPIGNCGQHSEYGSAIFQ